MTTAASNSIPPALLAAIQARQTLPSTTPADTTAQRDVDAILAEVRRCGGPQFVHRFRLAADSDLTRARLWEICARLDSLGFMLTYSDFWSSLHVTQNAEAHAIRSARWSRFAVECAANVDENGAHFPDGWPAWAQDGDDGQPMRPQTWPATPVEIRTDADG